MQRFSQNPGAGVLSISSISPPYSFGNNFFEAVNSINSLSNASIEFTKTNLETVFWSIHGLIATLHESKKAWKKKEQKHFQK